MVALMKEDVVAYMEMLFPECNMLEKFLARYEECITADTDSLLCIPMFMIDQTFLGGARYNYGPVGYISDHCSAFFCLNSESTAESCEPR